MERGKKGSFTQREQNNLTYQTHFDPGDDSKNYFN